MQIFVLRLAEKDAYENLSINL